MLDYLQVPQDERSFANAQQLRKQIRITRQTRKVKPLFELGSFPAPSS